MQFDLYGDRIGRVELVDHMGTDLTVVNAARVSYGGNKQELDDKDKKLIKYLIKNHHTSPFEHCQITFKFTVPLFVRSQHHRHRTWAFNEISRRYTADNLEFYEPIKWRTQSTDNKQCSDNEFDSTEFNNKLKEHCQKSLDLYNEMVDGGVAREMARMVLPQNLYTSYYGSVSLHNAIHFLKLRLHPHAQWEIQRVAQAMKMYMERLYPHCMSIWSENV